MTQSYEKPTPEEKRQECGCPNEYPCSGAHSRPNLKNMNKCHCGHWHHQSLPCPIDIEPSPSPEARVDWDREAEIIIHAIPADCEDDYFQMSKTIIKNALQAAFEKGREAR